MREKLCLSLNRGNNYRGEFAAPTLVEFYRAFLFGKKRIIPAAADIYSRMDFCSALTNDNRPRLDKSAVR